MNIQKCLLENEDQICTQLAAAANVDQGQAAKALEQVIPQISAGFKHELRNEQTTESLFRALNEGDHAKYLENPSQLNQDATITDGNKILGHIFGNKDVSKKVASHVEQQSGVASSIITTALPMVAALAMGALSRQATDSGLLANSLTDQTNRSGLATNLSTFLDTDGDGSIMDNLVGLISKFITK